MQSDVYSNNTFIFYLVFVATMIVLFLLLFILYISGKKKIKAETVNVIDFGSVSVFFDKKGNVTVIPYRKDKYGTGRAVGSPRFLSVPYRPFELGEVVRNSFVVCRKEAVCPSQQLMSFLQCKDWKEFSYGRRNISAYYKEELGLVFNTTKRMPDGSYRFNFKGYEKVLAASASNDELGTTLLNMLERCR